MMLFSAKVPSFNAIEPELEKKDFDNVEFDMQEKRMI